MADRGRKAFPVSSHLCDERTRKQNFDMHKKRLGAMKSMTDSSEPDTFKLRETLSNNTEHGKKAYLKEQRRLEVAHENEILLEKCRKITEADTTSFFRPWSARSTFQFSQFAPGTYYDPMTQQKTIDHINQTLYTSPRSVHYSGKLRPGSAMLPSRTEQNRSTVIQQDNTKLLKAIALAKSTYSIDGMERKYVEESVLLDRISNFRGPAEARFVPPARAASAGRAGPNLNPYLTQILSSQRPGSARPAISSGVRQRPPPRPSTAAPLAHGTHSAGAAMYGVGTGRFSLLQSYTQGVLHSGAAERQAYERQSYGRPPRSMSAGGDAVPSTFTVQAKSSQASAQRPYNNGHTNGEQPYQAFKNELSTLSEGSQASSTHGQAFRSEIQHIADDAYSQDDAEEEDEILDADHDPSLLNQADDVMPPYYYPRTPVPTPAQAQTSSARAPSPAAGTATATYQQEQEYLRPISAARGTNSTRPMSARPASARPMSALGAGVSGLGAGASYSLAQTAASAGGGVTLRTAHEDEVIAGAGGMRQSASLLSLSLHEGQEEEEAGAQEEGLTARGPAQPLSATQELDALAESNQQEQEYEQQQEAQEASSTLGANEAAPQEDEQNDRQANEDSQAVAATAATSAASGEDHVPLEVGRVEEERAGEEQAEASAEADVAAADTGGEDAYQEDFDANAGEEPSVAAEAAIQLSALLDSPAAAETSAKELDQEHAEADAQHEDAQAHAQHGNAQARVQPSEALIAPTPAPTLSPAASTTAPATVAAEAIDEIPDMGAGNFSDSDEMNAW